MVKSGILIVGLSVSAAFMTSAPVYANDGAALSAEEIGDIFKKQKTRGLVLAPSGGSAATTEDTTQTTTAAAQPATTSVEPTTTAYTQLDKDSTIAVQIKFDFDSAALRNDQKSKLTNLCTAMQSVDGAFRIIGHTDASGSADYNERLSLLRAQEVKRHMVAECGISETRLQAIGVGEEFPSNTANPRADENRRVEFQALS